MAIARIREQEQHHLEANKATIWSRRSRTTMGHMDRDVSADGLAPPKSVWGQSTLIETELPRKDNIDHCQISQRYARGRAERKHRIVYARTRERV